jgi:SPP1 gp7 family putative phage head morphogenesis protein
MKRLLTPIRHRDAYTRLIESEVVKYFEEVIFGPVLEILTDARIENTKESVVERALRSGKIHWADGKFSGAFNASISKQLREMGATFDSSSMTFSLPASQMPLALRMVVYDSLDKAKKIHKTLDTVLEQMQLNIAMIPVPFDVTGSVNRIISDLDKQFSTCMTADEAVEVSADVTPFIRKNLDEKFTNNLNLYIKKFASEEIPELRRLVEQNGFAGFRTDRLADLIQSRFGVSKRKAAFLADQETSLLMAKYRQERYAEIGIREYQWSTSHDERVREDHKILNGEIFSFTSPPVTNRRTGARNNPGEDYRCRCVPIPIIDSKVLDNARSKLVCNKKCATLNA